MRLAWPWPPAASGVCSIPTPPDTSPFDHHIYCLASDGDIEEGVSSETSSLAATQRLGNLTLIYDSNHLDRGRHQYRAERGHGRVIPRTAGMSKTSTGPMATARTPRTSPPSQKRWMRRGQ